MSERREYARCNFGEALVRAERGIAEGAGADALGVLECVQASAHHNRGQSEEAARCGLSALRRLDRTGLYWSTTVECPASTLLGNT